MEQNWYLSYDGKTEGPVSLEAARRLADRTPKGHAWHEGFVSWQPIPHVLELQSQPASILPPAAPAPGESLNVDTGCLVAMEPSVSFDLEQVGGVKSALFGGEGLFFAHLRGPGRIWIQSLPFSRLAGRMLAATPAAGGRRVGEGSILGGLGGLLNGDNQ